MGNSNEKQWWAPVWKGLVMDEDGKHYHRMKNAIWLFLYLVLNANRRTGFLMRKVRTISSDMGITRDTTLRWLKILREEGYIATVNTGRYLSIQIKKWKALSGVGKTQRQKVRLCNFRNGNHPTPEQTDSNPVPVHSGPKSPVFPDPNDISINKNILNNDIRKQTAQSQERIAFKGVGLCVRRHLLALDLAKALDDLPGIALYRSYCKRYPEWLLRKVLGEVEELPPEKIKKGRAALFNHLVQRYAQSATENLGD